MPLLTRVLAELRWERTNTPLQALLMMNEPQNIKGGPALAEYSPCARR